MSSSDEKDIIQKTKDYIRKFISDINAKEVAVLIIFGLLLFFIFKLMFGGIFGVSLVVIENGPCPNSSMCPTYDKGDMFVINKCAPEKINLGDVIVYESFNVPGLLIIHRVINITIITNPSGDQYFYRVSGDNPGNNYPDKYDTSTLIPYEAVKGKTVLLIRKIGYLRLWLAANNAIRNIILILVVGLGAYLILAPDKKKAEEEKEVKEITQTEIVEKKPLKQRSKDYFINLGKNTKKWFIELFTVKKKRIKLIIFCSIILALVIFIPVIDNAIRTPGISNGIVGVSNVTERIDPAYVDEGIVYFYYLISYQQDGSWNKVLKSFLVEGIQNDTVLGKFYWYSFYQVEGNRTIGGSLIFLESEFNRSLDLTFRITYTIHYRFGPDQAPQQFIHVEPGPF